MFERFKNIFKKDATLPFNRNFTHHILDQSVAMANSPTDVRRNRRMG